MKHIKYAKLVPLGDRFHIVQSTGSCFQVLPYLLYLPGVTTVGTPHSLMLDAPEALVSPPEIKPLHYKTIVQTPAICLNIHP